MSSKRKSGLFLLAGSLLGAGILAMLIMVSFGTGNTYAAPPGPGPRPTPLPSANVVITNLEHIFNPNPVVAGQPVTYTVNVYASSVLNASDISFDLMLMGDEKFIAFNPLNSGMSLIYSDTTKVTIKVNNLTAGQQTGDAQIYAIAPTNLSRPVIQQSIFVKWTDLNGYYNKQFIFSAALANPPNNVSPITTPPAVSQPSNGLPTSGPFAAQNPPTGSYTSGDVWYFAATKHYIGFGFLTYWKTHGSTTVLGWPISEEFQENGQTVQYFERGVLEYHPENQDPYRTQLRLLGNELNNAQAAVSGDNTPSDGAQYFPETGHWLAGNFVDTWNSKGGLTQFGYPTGEAASETLANGDVRIVQWTERARFEQIISRANQPVTLGLLGKESAVNKGYLPG